jgi:hypothetical protein
VVSPRVWVTIVVLTGLAVALLVVPPRWVPVWVPDWVIFAAVIADLIAVGLIARDWRALWAAVALAACSCVAWYVYFFSGRGDDGLFDGVILGLIALAAAAAAVSAGVLVGRLCG